MNADHPWSMFLSSAPGDAGPEEKSTMFDRDFKAEPLTKEEFIEGIRDAVQDMADPDGEFNELIGDMREAGEAARPFDPGFTAKVMAVVASFEDLGAYIKGRAEFLGASAIPGTDPILVGEQKN